MNSWALYYNKSMLKAAGISVAAHHAGPALRRPGQGVEDLRRQAGADRLLPELQPGLRVLRQLLRRGQLLRLRRASTTSTNCPGATDRGELPRPVRQLPVLARRGHGRPRTAAVAGGDDDPFVAGKEGFDHGRALGGRAEHPGHEPGHGQQLRRRAVPRTRSAARARSARATTTSSPRAPRTRSRRSSSSPGWPATTTRPSTSQIDPKGGWMPTSPSVVPQPAYQAWLKANPWLNVFVQQMSSPLSVTPKLTTTESEFETAEATATENIAEHSQTPAAGAGLHRPAGQQRRRRLDRVTDRDEQEEVEVETCRWRARRSARSRPPG